MSGLRLVALVLPMMVAVAALGEPSDGGAAAAVDAGGAGVATDGGTPADAAPQMVAPLKAAPLVPAAPAAKTDAPARARPTPIYKSALFWTSIVLGAGAVTAIGAGIGLMTTFHSRYALVKF